MKETNFMKVYLNEVTGIADAITSMFMSKRTWTRELENDIRRICNLCLKTNGEYIPLRQCGDCTNCLNDCKADYETFNNWMTKLIKWGTKHITMLRYIDFSITVKGLHRAGQDDVDSHSMRFNNRIIRSSTRLATYGNEMSEWYKEKIIPTDTALGILDHTHALPESIEHNGKTYVKTINGYIEESLKDDKDAKRGLYMLSIPSNFIFKVNLTEWSHVYKERNINSGANPEVKQCCEMIADEIERFQPLFNRDLFAKIKN